MEAGRELDALMAEKVMGWKRPTRKFEPWDCMPDNETAAVYLTPYQLPRFSTDIAAAWEVVEKVAPTVSLEDRFVLSLNEGGEWFADFGMDAVSTALTAPHAICLAALKAVGAA